VPLSDGLDTRPCKILDPRLDLEMEVFQWSPVQAQSLSEGSGSGKSAEAISLLHITLLLHTPNSILST